jgi:predicted nucleotidyltransferase
LTARRLSSSRVRVANEAASLLYTGQEKEYKQAKLKAAKMLGVHILPSNAEVAGALDNIAEEREGEERRKNLVLKRKEALQIMKSLRKMYPRLTGSVWRGTAHKNSDIDVVAFSDNPEAVLEKLERSNYEITDKGWQSVTKRGEEIRTFHIHLTLSSSSEVEVIVRRLERKRMKEICEIYGDVQTGLEIHQLARLLETTPAQKFTPT